MLPGKRFSQVWLHIPCSSPRKITLLARLSLQVDSYWSYSHSGKSWLYLKWPTLVPCTNPVWGVNLQTTPCNEPVWSAKGWHLEGLSLTANIWQLWTFPEEGPVKPNRVKPNVHILQLNTQFCVTHANSSYIIHTWLYRYNFVGIALEISSPSSGVSCTKHTSSHLVIHVVSGIIVILVASNTVQSPYCIPHVHCTQY